MSKLSKELGTKPIGKLIVAQSVPAAIGILVMSLNMIVDTIFVGNWIGANAIAAITIVLPITFLIASFGMAVGIGGASIISRAFGEDNDEKAHHVFGNQILLSLSFSLVLLVFGLIFREQALVLSGAKGEVLEPARHYYTIIMYGVPFLALFMTGNPVIRAEGQPKFSMYALIIPAIVNVVMDYFCIVVWDMGISGAAWATTTAYLFSFLFVYWFFVSKFSELQIKLRCLKLEWNIVKEIASLGGVTLARQGVVSALSIILSHALYKFGGGTSLAVYGIISRLLMFALFPVLGIAQGFMPIAGYNFGAKKYVRLKETITKSLLYASALAVFVFLFIMIFPGELARAFTDDKQVLKEASSAVKIVFLVTPLIAIQLIGSAYFQAIGKAKKALILTLTKQGFFLIPLILILPNYFGLLGIWISFPIADFASTLVTGVFLQTELKKYKVGAKLK